MKKNSVAHFEIYHRADLHLESFGLVHGLLSYTVEPADTLRSLIDPAGSRWRAFWKHGRSLDGQPGLAWSPCWFRARPLPPKCT